MILTERKKKRSSWNKGKKLSEKHRLKLSIAHQGNVGYWRGKKRPDISEKLSGIIRPKEVGRKISESLKGRKHSEEWKEKIRGEKNPNWKGGVSFNYRQGYKKQQMKWRNAILERDDWVCQGCKKRGGKLCAHHIKDWKDYPNLRFNLNNGITLCKECHQLEHKSRLNN